MFKFLNQCFARLWFWKSVSDSQNLLDGATAVLLEAFFQNRSRAKHWFKNLNILGLKFKCAYTVKIQKCQIKNKTIIPDLLFPGVYHLIIK